MVLGMLCFMAAGTACAKTYTYSDPTYQKGEYVCEDFVGELPQAAKEAFADVLKENDEIICGTMVCVYVEDEFEFADAVMAVRREGKQLLLGAAYIQGDTWRSSIESDCFLPENQVYSMTSVPDYTKKGNLRSVYACIRAGDETVYLDCQDGGQRIFGRIYPG